MRRLVLACFAVVACQIAQAEDFPVRPVRVIVANPPGGTADMIGRLLAKVLGEIWRQSVIVDNRGGGSGAIGTDLVAKATPNGYTLLVSAPGPITTNAVFGKLPYDPIKDLAPIMLIGVTPSLLMVGPSVPSKSIAELVALAKARPGKLNYASSGLGNQRVAGNGQHLEPRDTAAPRRTDRGNQLARRIHRRCACKPSPGQPSAVRAACNG